MRELSPAVQLAAAKATFERTKSLVGALSQMASDVVLGAAEHAQGFGIITARYRITEKGLASEVTIRNPDGFAATRTFYLRELLNPPPERIALNPKYRPVSQKQVAEQLATETDFQSDRTVHTAVLMSLGHEEGSDRNWMYLFLRDKEDPDLVRLVAIRLPDDKAEALAFRDRMLEAAGLKGAISPEDPFGRIILRGDSASITPEAVAAAARNGLFGVGAGELASLGSDGFEVIQQRQAAEIEALTREMLEQLDAAELDTIGEKLELAMQLAGRYLLGALGPDKGSRSDDGPDGSDAGGASDAQADGLLERASAADQEAVNLAAMTASEMDAATIDSASEFVAQEDLETEWIRESEAESGADSELELNNDQEELDPYLTAEVEGGDEGYEPVQAEQLELEATGLTADGTRESEAESGSDSELELKKDQEELDPYLSAEVESGDDGYEPVQSDQLELELAELTESRQAQAEEDDDSQLNLILDLSPDNESDSKEKEAEGGDGEEALLEGQELSEEERLLQLIEELGGDVSLLSSEPGEVSPLGLLIADGELPAFSELGELSELMLAAEITDAVSADYDEDRDEGQDLDQVDGAELEKEDGAALESEDPSGAVESGAEASDAADDREPEAAQTGAGVGADGESEELSNEEVIGDLLELQASAEGFPGALSDPDELDAASEDEETELDEEAQAEADAEANGAESSELDAVISRGLGSNRSARRRAALRVLNRLRYQAERLGVDVFELMKLRQRRGLKRLWFEQLIFALAREMKFTFEQRQALARELELSSSDFDDIRQAELSVRRELHVRKLKTKPSQRLVDPLVSA